MLLLIFQKMINRLNQNLLKSLILIWKIQILQFNCKYSINNFKIYFQNIYRVVPIIKIVMKQKIYS